MEKEAVELHIRENCRRICVHKVPTGEGGGAGGEVRKAEHYATAFSSKRGTPVGQ